VNATVTLHRTNGCTAQLPLDRSQLKELFMTAKPDSQQSAWAVIGSIIGTGFLAASTLGYSVLSPNAPFKLVQQSANPAAQSPQSQQPQLQQPASSPQRGFATPAQPVATSQLPESEIVAVEVDRLQPFQHSTGVFSIEVPSNWKVDDSSEPGVAIVLWMDPAENGLLGVGVFEQEIQLPDRELAKLLQNFVQDAAKSEQELVINVPQQQPDGSTSITGTFTSIASNGARIRMTFNSLIEQKADKIGMMIMALPESAVERLTPVLNQILQSYQLNPAARLAKP
jgi:hypothetical protein